MLHTLAPAKGSRRKPKRVGRGISAGGGKTCGQGTKGQQSRVGKGRRFGFEGGQTPLLRRQPKLGGFRNPNRVPFETVTLASIERMLPAGTYAVQDLRAAKVARTKRPIKIVGKDAVTKKFELTVRAASAGAKKAVEKAGGKILCS